MAENPASWGTVEKCIFKHCHKPSLTIAHELSNSKLVPKTTDLIALADKLDAAVQEFHKSIEDGVCGPSLPAILADAVRSHLKEKE